MTMRTSLRLAAGLGLSLLLAAAARGADVRTVTSTGQLPDGFAETLSRLERKGTPVEAMTISNTGEWAVVAGGAVDASAGFPAAARQAIDRALGQRLRVEAIAAQGPRWAVVARGQVSGEGLSPEVERAIRDLHLRGKSVTSLALMPGSPQDWALAGGGQIVHSRGVPAGLVRAAEAAGVGERPITAVALGGGGSWALVAGGWWASEGAPPELVAALGRLPVTDGRALDLVELRPNGGWAVVSNGIRGVGGAPADRIESELGPGRESIERRMQEHQVTGLAVSWVEGNRRAWSRSWGLRDADAPESRVYPWTVFEAASLAKPVSSAAALQLAGNNLGLLEDLSQRGLPELFQGRTELDLRRGSGINLYLLLSHCAGLRFAKQVTDEDELGVEAFDPGTRLPSLRQVLLGDGPASPDYRVMQAAPPGQQAVFSGVNHTLLQAVIDDRAPGGFAAHARSFLAAAGMGRSGFDQPMPSAVEREAAFGHRRGRKQQHKARPAAASAGLWSTAEDLAAFVALLNGRGTVDGRQVLQPSLVDSMLGRDAVVDRLCANRMLDAGLMGLGVFVDRSRINTRDELFWHRGTQGGYRSYIFGLPGRRQGLAVTMSAGARDADAFARELLDAFSRVYGLPRLPE